MKRSIGLFMLCWLPIILFSSCINEDYSGCPSKNSRKMVRIHVDWHLFDKEVPTGMTVMVFPRSGGAPQTVLTNDITHADFSLEPGSYRVLVFNQSTTEFGTLSFLGMNSYETARVVVQHTTSRWYSRGDGEHIGVEPEWFASDKLDELKVVADSSEVTMHPRNVLSRIEVRVQVPGIDYLRYARGSLTGISDGYLLGQGKALRSKVTHLLESWTKTKDKDAPSIGFLNTSFRCFGLPEEDEISADNNKLAVSALLVDNKTQVDYHFAVGDKFEKEKDSSNIGYLVSLQVHVAFPEPLPEVKPSDTTSGGGFDVNVEEWGKPEDIDMEL